MRGSPEGHGYGILLLMMLCRWHLFDAYNYAIISVCPEFYGQAVTMVQWGKMVDVEGREFQ
ncbi:hypothetical protein Tco_1128920, partial [Tanacetum coccineum]